MPECQVDAHRNRAYPSTSVVSRNHPATYENREVIVAHETQIAQGLRAIERAYHAALGHTPTIELSWMFHSGDPAPDRELEPG